MVTNQCLSLDFSCRLLTLTQNHCLLSCLLPSPVTWQVRGVSATRVGVRSTSVLCLVTTTAGPCGPLHLSWGLCGSIPTGGVHSVCSVCLGPMPSLNILISLNVPFTGGWISYSFVIFFVLNVFGRVVLTLSRNSPDNLTPSPIRLFWQTALPWCPDPLHPNVTFLIRFWKFIWNVWKRLQRPHLEQKK